MRRDNAASAMMAIAIAIAAQRTRIDASSLLNQLWSRRQEASNATQKRFGENSPVFRIMMVIYHTRDKRKKLKIYIVEKFEYLGLMKKQKFSKVFNQNVTIMNKKIYKPLFYSEIFLINCVNATKNCTPIVQIYYSCRSHELE